MDSIVWSSFKTRDNQTVFLMQTQQISVELGQTLMTRGVSDLLSLHPELHDFIQQSIYRHSIGDWGDLSNEDRQSNDEAITKGRRLLSSYILPITTERDSKIYIITEADRSVTTVLFSSEY